MKKQAFVSAFCLFASFHSSCVSTVEASYTYAGKSELSETDLRDKLNKDLSHCDKVAGQKLRGQVRMISVNNPSSEDRHRYCMERRKWLTKYENQE